jgi:hypothetical protein
VIPLAIAAAEQQRRAACARHDSEAILDAIAAGHLAAHPATTEAHMPDSTAGQIIADHLNASTSHAVTLTATTTLAASDDGPATAADIAPIVALYEAAAEGDEVEFEFVADWRR